MRAKNKRLKAELDNMLCHLSTYTLNIKSHHVVTEVAQRSFAMDHIKLERNKMREEIGYKVIDAITSLGAFKQTEGDYLCINLDADFVVMSTQQFQRFINIMTKKIGDLKV